MALARRRGGRVTVVEARGLPGASVSAHHDLPGSRAAPISRERAARRDRPRPDVSRDAPPGSEKWTHDPHPGAREPEREGPTGRRAGRGTGDPVRLMG